MFHYSSNFTVANSTIAFNFGGLYARNGSFQIIGNDVYGNTRSGSDIRVGSTNFVMGGNHVHDNGYEGMAAWDPAESASRAIRSSTTRRRE